MICPTCKKDKIYWSEIHTYTRKDNTANCGASFAPGKPKRLIRCYECIEKHGLN